MAANMLTAYDITQAGTAGQEAAAQFVNSQDLNQQNKIALRLQQMQLANMEKQQGVKNFLSSNWQQATGQPQAPVPGQAAPVQQPVGPTDQPPQGQPPAAGVPQGQPAIPNNLMGPPQGQPGPGMQQPGQPPAPQGQPAGPAGAQPPRPQYPTDEQLMQAVQSGKLPMEVADGVRAERNQFEQTQRQGQIQSKLEYYKKLGEKFATDGNNEGFQNLMTQAQADPDVAQYMPKFDKIEVTGKQETTMQTDMTATARENLLKKSGDNPLLIETINGLKDGQKVEIKQKAGKITEIKPIKDVAEATQTPEQLRKVFTDPKRSEAERKTAWEDFKLAPLTVNQLTAIKSNTSLPAKYRKFATDTLAEMNKQKSEFHMSIKGSMNDDGADSFKDYTPQMKEQAFKDRDLGQYRYPSGMKSMAEKKAFDKEYYQYRVSGKIDAADVVGKRADSKAMNDLVKREQLIGTFVYRIEETSKVVKDAAKAFKNTDSRLMNMPLNQMAGVIGSGKLQALKLALASLSREVGKVESGSIGIAGLDVTTAQMMDKIHDSNLSFKDTLIVLDMGKKLGDTSKLAIKKQRMDLRERMAGSGQGGGVAAGAPVPKSGIMRFDASGKRLE